MTFLVTPAAARPAGPADECFYCQQKVGQPHGEECVTVVKRVRVRATVEYEVYKPASWAGDMVEFHLNESSWCADNMVDDLRAYVERLNGRSHRRCLCSSAKFEFVSDESAPLLNEGDERRAEG